MSQCQAIHEPLGLRAEEPITAAYNHGICSHVETGFVHVKGFGGSTLHMYANAWMNRDPRL